MPEMPHPGALSDLTVVDLTQQIAGPYCTKLMAGFGASVIKVEKPSGDRSRRLGPFVAGTSDGELSIPFLWLNTGKKSVALDLSTNEGREKLDRMLRVADVLALSYRPRTRGRLSLEWEELHERHPHLVVTSVSNFGESGAYRDYEAEEIVEYALSGLMHLTGTPGRPPLCAGPAIAQYTAGMHAYLGTIIALLERERTKEGRQVEVSVQEAAIDNVETVVAEYFHLGKIPKRSGDAHNLVPWELFPCRTGHAAVIGGPIRKWLPAATMFEEPALLDVRYAHMADRIAHRAETKALLQPWLDKQEARDIYHLGQARGLAFGYLANLEDAMSSAQHKARHFFDDVGHPLAGLGRYCGPPFRSSELGWRSCRAPLLDEHYSEVFADTSQYREQRDEVREPRRPPVGATTRLPLEGVRITDLTQNWAGPHATRLVADFGAEVLKVEYARRMDIMRGAYVQEEAYNRHPRWFEINRNKLSVTLDLKKEADLEACKQLVRRSDVVVECSRPGVLDGLGLSYQVLKELRPDIILVSMSAFGSGGPESSYGGYGGTLEALSGVQSLTAYDVTDRRMRIREVDVVNGVLGACAIVTALIQRQQTGQGQWIDLSQFEAATSGLIGEHLLARSFSAPVSLPSGNRSQWWAPQGCYPCQGQDQWVTIAIRSEEEFEALCRTLGHPELAGDERFATADGRVRHHDQLDRVIEKWTRGRSHRRAMTELQAAGVPAGAVLTVAELADDPHLRERRFFLPDPADGLLRYPGVPFRLSGIEVAVRRRGPSLGQDNAEVFGSLAGLDPAKVGITPDSEIGTAYDVE
jgi:crotonobetainyl-CoA:carnitine CoA-transferase CaiB-like acyl-CoA transferase